MAKNILTDIDMNQHKLKNFALPDGDNTKITDVADGYISRIDDEIYMASNGKWKRFIDYDTIDDMIASSIMNYHDLYIAAEHPVRYFRI